jgi:hypothetical protein
LNIPDIVPKEDTPSKIKQNKNKRVKEGRASHKKGQSKLS